ncbi:hypothetical protein [Nocardia sp.]|uniref:hypothetical protein n=1 Tax=Nocardia sp. TaxID=1821 RepID=UPI002602F204|nr:hypothetical protein [Nocardia sp.]
MDADFTTGLGSSLNSRQESYRLTHPDTADPGISQNPVLTGVDTGNHATLGRTSLDQPEQPVQWSAPVTRRSAPEVDSPVRRSVQNLDAVPQWPADLDASPRRAAPDLDSTPRLSTSELESVPRRAAPDLDSVPRLSTPDFDMSAHRSATEVDSPVRRLPTDFDSAPHRAVPDFDSSPRRAAPDLDSGPRRAAPDLDSGPRRAAPEPSHRRAAPEPELAEPSPRPDAARAREFRAEDAPNIDLHHIMSLLVASHDLDVAAQAAEAEGVVSDLTQAARRTRAAAVDLIAAWYGGPEHMRKFGEVLLQAAAETA